MDHLLLSLVGKPQLNSPKILTVTADNFSLVEDQARFMKATIAIPNVKKLPFENDGDKIFIQLGPIHAEVKAQLLKANWTVNQFDDCDLAEIRASLASHKSRCLVYFNDVSKVILLASDQGTAFLRLVDDWKRCHGHFVVLFFQNSLPQSNAIFVKKLECVSDAYIRTRAFKDGYFKAMWWQTVPEKRTLIDSMIETIYCTCKIGKFYWSSDLLCFYERQKVPKNFDPEKDTCFAGKDSNGSESEEDDNEDNASSLDSKLSKRMGESGLLNADEDDSEIPITSNLPYTRAQNPERSRIFYYPDKDDDIDEDDPDNDLNL